MLKHFKLIGLISFGCLTAQGAKVETVYFDFNKYSLEAKQEQILLDSVIHADTSQIESLQIYGYCDDRGSAEYNYRLSKDRANEVLTNLTSHGFDKNKIVILEGRGRVMLSKNGLENLAETRSKNRRVDIIIERKNSFGKGIYTSFQNSHIVGDLIYLKKVFFPFGSSALSKYAKEELDRVAIILQNNKNLEFEIRGHVCCTQSYYEDAIDRDTNERNLSLNRAKNVFWYLKTKNVNSLRMTYRGYGNQFPLQKGAEFDRRVELLITKI
ncbi:MAG: outer membrane protein OmpA-like peptidoglycan-associated protein [Porticoccaceae bacterium]|jgi:outer membrane protein OmpA-like peptidoglycan-associated protein